jgi:hypothetical protein
VQFLWPFFSVRQQDVGQFLFLLFCHVPLPFKGKIGQPKPGSEKKRQLLRKWLDALALLVGR